MHKTAFTIASLLALTATQSHPLLAEEGVPEVQHEQGQPFAPFTGRVTRNKVRMRLQPNLDCPIVKELDRDQMLIVVDEDEDFYTVKPTETIKAYIYRTYVLDGIVEGDRVNVRLEPTLDAPVIGQLSTGEKIDGQISSLNSKWMEINPPASTKFYVCKDYLEEIGDASMMVRIEQRRLEVNGLLNASYLLSQSELDKPFEYVQLDKAYDGFSRVIDEYHDFPEQVGRATELLAETQEAYLQKKIKYLEEKTHSVTARLQQAQKNSSAQEQTLQQQLGLGNTSTVYDDLAYHDSESVSTSPSESFQWEKCSSPLEGAMASWVGTENDLYTEWTKDNQGTIETFYSSQLGDAVTLRGVIQPYNRLIKNKPGDFVLLSQATRNPIAYLYSTKVSLKELEGNVVTIKVSERNNQNFAFPAYFVLEAE